MSPRRTTVPPTRKRSRSSSPGRSELIARTKDEKQSAKRRTALDNRFYRTFLRFTGANRTRRSIALAKMPKRFASGATAS
jgi:hypothetical protein